jgi:predicted ATPase
VSVSSEIAILKGASGAGKSFLTQLVGSFIISKGGLFLMGKFDQMQQSRPFSALASALDQYCDILISQLGSLFGQIW